MSYQDKNPTCPDCRRSFTFSAEEQGLCGELGYDQPKRCRTCRQSRQDTRRFMGGDGGRSRPRELHAGTVPRARSGQIVAIERLRSDQPIAVAAWDVRPLLS